MPAFLDIARDVSGEYWTAENFQRNLPEKWRLSFAAWNEEAPIAYAIVSARAAGHAHLHHFMIHRDFRGSGLGGKMIAEMERRARCYERLTLKAHVDNADAVRFYAQHGYRVTGRDGAYNWLERDLRPASSAET